MHYGRSLVVSVLWVFLLIACTKPDGGNNDAVFLKSNPLLSELTVSAGGSAAPYSFTYDQNNNLTVALCYVAPTGSIFVGYIGTQITGVGLGGLDELSVLSDANNTPAYGVKKHAPYASSGKGTTYQVDSCIYKTDNGRVIYIGYFSYTSFVTDYSRTPPNYIVNIKDSFAIYRVLYNGNTVSRIRSEVKPGKIIEQEFTWGTRRGIFSNANPIPLVCPENTLSYGFVFLSLLSKNELLSWSRTYVNENNRKETTTYAYTYNKYGYPTDVTITESGTSAVAYKLSFAYQ